MSHWKHLAVVVALFMARTLWAADCGTTCSFIRGDANCSGGAPNASDLYPISSGQYLNGDAADVNDNGIVDNSDFAYLAAWLYQGGPPPKCPFPNAGHDCTADNLEPCCSKPTGAQTTLPNGNCTPVVMQGDWDFWNATLGVGCQSQVTLWNESRCDHPSPTWGSAGHDIGSVDDTTHFTKKRLQNGIQTASLYVSVIMNFVATNVCSVYGCTGGSSMAVDMAPMTITVIAKNSATGATRSFALENHETYLFPYHRQYIDGACRLVVDGSTGQFFQATTDITGYLAALPDADCDQWEIDSINISDVDMAWVGTPDVAYEELIKVTLYAEASYGWCTCGS